MSIDVIAKKRSNEWDEYELALIAEGYSKLKKNPKMKGRIYANLETAFRGIGYPRSFSAIDIKMNNITYYLTNGAKGISPKVIGTNKTNKRFLNCMKLYKAYLNGKDEEFLNLLSLAHKRIKKVPSLEIKRLKIGEYLTYHTYSVPYYCTFCGIDLLQRNSKRKNNPIRTYWASLFRNLVREIYRNKRFEIPYKIDGKVFISHNKKELKNPDKFYDKLYLDMVSSPIDMFVRLTKLMGDLGYKESDIIMKYNPKEE